jgi:hypothetical protein
MKFYSAIPKTIAIVWIWYACQLGIAIAEKFKPLVWYTDSHAMMLGIVSTSALIALTCVWIKPGKSHNNAK